MLNKITIISNRYHKTWASLVAQQERIRLQCRRHGFDPWVRKIPWRRAWQPNPVLLPRESHGQRSLAGYSPLALTESDTTEATYHACTHRHWKENLPWQDHLARL